MDVRQGSVYEFNTTLGSLRDTTLTLRDAAGNRIAFDDDGGNGLASRITWTANHDGPVFVTVRAYAGSQSGTYSLAVNGFSNVRDRFFADLTTPIIHSASQIDDVIDQMIG